MTGLLDGLVVLLKGLDLTGRFMVLVVEKERVKSDLQEGDTADIGLKDLVLVIWNARWFIFLASFLVSVFSVYYALSIPNKYRSSAILTSATGTATSASGLAGQFGGLASLAGVNLGVGADEKIVIAMELLRTWGFLESFVREHNLVPEVMAVERWDEASGNLIFDASVFNAELSEWVTDENGDSMEPTSWQVFERINQQISINKSSKTGLITLTVEHVSPNIAKKWADILVVSINEHIRQQDKREALSGIEYLKKQVDRTQVAEMRTIFFELIEEQTKALMLAEVNSEYVFKTVSPAKIASARSSPGRTKIVILGAFVGLLGTVFIVLLRYFILREMRRSS